MKNSIRFYPLAIIILTLSTTIRATEDIVDELVDAHVRQRLLNSAALYVIDDAEFDALLRRGAKPSCDIIMRQVWFGGPTGGGDATQFDAIYAAFRECMEQKQVLLKIINTGPYKRLFEDGYAFNFELWQYVLGRSSWSHKGKENRNMLAAIKDKFQDTWSPEEQQLSTEKMQNFAAIERGQRVEEHIKNLYWRSRDANGTDDISQQHMHKLGRLLNKGAKHWGGRDYCGEIEGLFVNITSVADNEMIFDYFEQCMSNPQFKPLSENLRSMAIIKKLESRGFDFSFAHWKHAFHASRYRHAYKRYQDSKEIASIMYASHDTWSEEERAEAKKIKVNEKAYNVWCKILGIDRLKNEPIKQDPTLDIQKLLTKFREAFDAGAELDGKSTIKILAVHPDLIECENLRRSLEYAMNNNYDVILSRWYVVEAEALLKAVQELHAHGYIFTREQLLKTIAWRDGYMNHVTTNPDGLSRKWMANRLKNLEQDMATYEKIIYIMAESIATRDDLV